MLKHFQKKFNIDAESLESSQLIVKAKRNMGSKLYGMAIRVFTEYVESRDISDSGGYFKFAMAMNDSTKRDSDYLWDRMIQIYGVGKQSEDYIKRILGTICMICVAKEGRRWLYKDDPDKKQKLEIGEIPTATEYFLEQTK